MVEIVLVYVFIHNDLDAVNVWKELMLMRDLTHSVGRVLTRDSGTVGPLIVLVHR